MLSYVLLLVTTRVSTVFGLLRQCMVATVSASDSDYALQADILLLPLIVGTPSDVVYRIPVVVNKTFTNRDIVVHYFLCICNTKILVVTVCRDC